jgi:hypothetical protein
VAVIGRVERSTGVAGTNANVDKLTPQTRRLVGFIRQLMNSKRQEGRGQSASTFSRKELREACGWSLTQVSVHLERLVALEYLALRHARLGSAFVYEILFDLNARKPLLRSAGATLLNCNTSMGTTQSSRVFRWGCRGKTGR